MKYIVISTVCLLVGFNIGTRFDRQEIVVDLPEEYPLMTKNDLLTGELNATKDTLFIEFAYAK